MSAVIEKQSNSKQSANPFFYQMLVSERFRRALEGLDSFDIAEFLISLRLDEIEQNIKLVSGKSPGDTKRAACDMGWHRYHAIGITSDDYCDYKAIILEGLDDFDENIHRHCACDDCDNVQSLGFDEQRHHFDTFEHLGDNEFKCVLCGSHAVLTDVSIVTEWGDDIDI